ncbi:hypothetical protein J2S30_003279 [Herbaspirillum rubrisubalbicans]|uniref:hypothetical protein n=1 Tax=Herbaspirillum rubrisubalbicans TaxID=80842 RepID=UPI0020A11AD3|nr:hypothetical protein [Herbaspirillum rubrisubalbicans]MCP1574900.1 hypothetical protein [Herbaspirillum rubrisubalbicans]
MIWEKLGLLYTPQALHPKLLSHAANPLALPLGGDLYRVFYSGRDHENRSSVGYVDIDLMARSVVYVHPEPLFEHGPEGSFYSHGVSIGNCYQGREHQHILFMGWQIHGKDHWRGDIGRLTVSDDLNTLSLTDPQPLMGVDPHDPVSLSYPWVEREGDLYRMWYGSTHTWDAGNGEMIHVINYASSTDGLQWQRHGLSVPFALGDAQAFSRPTVILPGASADGRYHMWFSYRSGRPGQTYRIGYAHSTDGVQWERDNAAAGIDIGADGWDSEMIEYPYVLQHRGQHYMLYNGNGFGKTGFGLAVLHWKR